MPSHNSNEEQSIYRNFDREHRLSEGKITPNNLDEIPLALCELNDAAVSYINKENYEKALILL
jgi:hypothetical protein